MTAPAPPGLAGLDITQPGVYLRPDYHELLTWLRDESPVHALPTGHHLVSRYADIRAISSQPERFASRNGVLVNDLRRGTEPDDDAGSIIHLDPPLHAPFRKLVNREFTPRAVGRIEPAVRRIAAEAFAALDELGPDDEVDLVDTLASPVPVGVIAELLGIADGDRADFRRWSDAIISATDAPDEQAIAAGGELFAFLYDHVGRRLADPDGDDLIALLARAEVGGVPLRKRQVVLFCVTLLVAGNETTRSLIAGGVEVLADHRDQRDRVAADPSLVPGTVEECLRWVTPIQAFCRTPLDDEVVGDVAVPAGSYLVLLYASGNRDERAFGPTAGSFDVARPTSPAHLAFGFGEHLCLGAALARAEGQIVLGELLARYPDHELAGPPELSPSTLTRGYDRVPVRLGGRRR